MERDQSFCECLVLHLLSMCTSAQSLQSPGVTPARGVVPNDPSQSRSAMTPFTQTLTSIKFLQQIKRIFVESCCCSPLVSSLFAAIVLYLMHACLCAYHSGRRKNSKMNCLRSLHLLPRSHGRFATVWWTVSFVSFHRHTIL